LEDGFSILLETDARGVVKIREHYCVIGEGAYLAQAALMYRDHTEYHPLARTLYCVFEAKKHAQRVSTVGPETDFEILTPGIFPGLTLTPKAEAHLADLFERYGPKNLNDEEHETMPPDFLENTLAWMQNPSEE
jgi:hypothetical protein